MSFVALDPTKLIVLMIAGGGFALAGLWLMFRPKPEGGAAKLELFGMKFEASSAGLLVFLIGAGFLGTPLIVPERPVSTLAEPALTLPEPPDGNAEPQSTESKRTSTSAVILPAAAGSKEKEPNSYLTEANQIERGTFYSGSIQPERGDAEDWYVVPTANLTNQDIVVQVRNRGGWCRAALYNDKEERLSAKYNTESGASFYLEAPVLNAEFFLVQFYADYDDSCNYEIMAQ